MRQAILGYSFPRSVPTILASASSGLTRKVLSHGNPAFAYRICLGSAYRPSFGTPFEPGLRVEYLVTQLIIDSS